MELLESLMTAGFTEYEARVYLTLLGEKPATGYQLSKKSGVPRSMVYEALGRLHARGAILKTDDHRSTLYRPVPPDTLLDRFQQEHHNLLQSLRENLRRMYNPQDEDRLWSIHGRSSVLSYASQMIQAAQSEMLLVLPDPDLLALRADIHTAYQRKVQVSALLTGSETLNLEPEPEVTGVQKSKEGLPPITPRIAQHPPLESKLQELTQLLVVVVDSKECLIASAESGLSNSLSSPASNWSGPDMSATITNNRNLVLISRQFIWMELFTQRIAQQLGPHLLALLAPEDRQILLQNFTEREDER